MKNFRGYKKYAYIYRLNTKIRLAILCLSGLILNYILIGSPELSSIL